MFNADKLKATSIFQLTDQMRHTRNLHSKTEMNRKNKLLTDSDEESVGFEVDDTGR